MTNIHQINRDKNIIILFLPVFFFFVQNLTCLFPTRKIEGGKNNKKEIKIRIEEQIKIKEMVLVYINIHKTLIAETQVSSFGSSLLN